MISILGSMGIKPTDIAKVQLHVQDEPETKHQPFGPIGKNQGVM